MNSDCFEDIEEIEDWHRVRLAVQNGWVLLDIYKAKRELEFSNGVFEEYPVYVLAKPNEEAAGARFGSVSKLQKRATDAAILEIQRALQSHDKAVMSESEPEQHEHSQSAKQSMLEAIRWIECLA